MACRANCRRKGHSNGRERELCLTYSVAVLPVWGRSRKGKSEINHEGILLRHLGSEDGSEPSSSDKSTSQVERGKTRIHSYLHLKVSPVFIPLRRAYSRCVPRIIKAPDTMKAQIILRASSQDIEALDLIPTFRHVR
jgi:hypothetical protein